jgi:signal transduction histidine kinase/HAMP domain-containing protein
MRGRGALPGGEFVFGSSIGGRIFGAFVAMSIIIAALGLYGYGVLSRAGDIVVATFDGPLMAINYARAANFDFVQMQKKLLERDAVPAASRAKIDADIDDLASTFSDDLGVAKERSKERDELAVIGQIETLFAKWNTARRKPGVATLKGLQTKLDDRFDMLVELNTDHSFVARRKAADAVGKFKYLTLAGIVVSLFLAIVITLFLARRIVKPLSAAASVADRIAAGEFETQIPVGGSDETGALLRSMTVMQDSIRTMMAREAEGRRAAESRLIDALETSGEGVMLVSPEGRVLIVNSQLRAFFPQVAERLIDGVKFGTAFALMQSQFKQATEGLDLAGGNMEHQLQDGRWLRFTASATSDGGTIVFLSDFTTIKEREESYRLAKQEAEAASAAKTRFVANMSHELRTPLNAVIGFSEMLSSEIFGALGHARYKEYANDITNSGKRLLGVINSVLDLANSQNGKIPLRSQNIDLHALLSECAQTAEAECADAGLRFTVQGIDQPLPVFGDADRLKQVFQNLLANAVKFNKKSGAVSLSAHITGNSVTVEIADTGIGMTPEEVDVALTPFNQVDARLERKYEGAGLGLPLSKAFVEAHDGRLMIESKFGAGTTVSVSFPRANAQVVRLAG